MTARVLCPALDAMLKKTIIALCEVNVQYNVCLEISGSLHIRADGERVFNCLIEEELNGKEKKLRKESLNDLEGFSIDLTKLHRDSMDSFTERDDDFEADDLGCFNLPQAELRSELTSEDEATLIAHQEALEISSTSSSQLSKSPASADVTAAAVPDLDTAATTAATNMVTPTLPVSQAKSNLAAIFPTPKVEPSVTSTQNQLPVSAYQGTNTTTTNSSETKIQNPLTNPIAAAATANPNLNLQAVAIAAALQRAAEASKRNIGMVLPTQSAPVATSTTATATANVAADNNQNQAQQPIETSQTNPVTVKEEQPENDVPLAPIGLNFQLALFQNQMAQIQMMQAANASAMLNIGTNVGLNTLNTAPGLTGPNLMNTTGLSSTLGSGLAALSAPINNAPVVTSAAPAESPPAAVPAISTPSTSKPAKSALSGGNPVRTTTGAKKWQCGFCGILVSSKFYLSSHINAVHTRTRIYPCDICGRLFYSHGAQRIHKLRYHWVDKRHKCPQCNQMFVLPVELRQHIQRKHKHALM